MVSFRLDPDRPDPEQLARAAAMLRAGGTVAFPTDTLYGLAIDPGNGAAVAQLYRIKGRQVDQALPLIACSLEQVEARAGRLAPLARALALRFWPGPLTLVIPAWAGLHASVHAGRGTIGVRVPAHPLARALADACGGPITATSANRSGEPPTNLPGDVERSLGAVLDALVDGGPSPGGLPSTLVDVTHDAPCLIRPGAVPWDRVLECLQ